MVARDYRQGGYTLLEVALSVAIVGIGILALMRFMTSATSVNRVNTQMSLATQYARGGWEVALGQGFDVVKTWTTNPPTAAPALATLSGRFERRIWVDNLDINSINGAAASGAISDKLRVNVEIRQNNTLVYSQRWILTKPS